MIPLPGTRTPNSAGMPIIMGDLISDNMDLACTGATWKGGIVKGRRGDEEGRTGGIMEILRLLEVYV